MKSLFLFATICLFLTFPTDAQVIPKTSHPPENTILFGLLKDLADKNVCGQKPDAFEILSGSVIHRDFSEDEMRLKGFVLRSANDSREYINLDYEYISRRAATASNDLRDWLVIGRKLEVSVYRCRRILFTHKITGL